MFEEGEWGGEWVGWWWEAQWGEFEEFIGELDEEDGVEVLGFAHDAFDGVDEGDLLAVIHGSCPMIRCRCPRCGGMLELSLVVRLAERAREEAREEWTRDRQLARERILDHGGYHGGYHGGSSDGVGRSGQREGQREGQSEVETLPPWPGRAGRRATKGGMKSAKRSARGKHRRG